MKIQCSCGAKYSFDVTPESAAQPVQFVCPACGLDSSALVNQLIRQQFGIATPAPIPAPPTTAPAAPAVPAASSRLRVSLGSAHAAPAPAAAESPAATYCAKHINEITTDQCAVCHKPICPKCMEMFGFFCSPFCKSKAEANNLNVPVYAGLSTAVESQFWSKVGLIFKISLAAVALLVGFFVWYGLFGSRPHAIFSVKYEQRAMYGSCKNVKPNQLVFLHGGTLARYDVKSQKPVWSNELITDKQVEDLTARLIQDESGSNFHTPADRLRKQARANLEEQLSLMVSDQNIWVGDTTQLTHYDWDTGKILQTVSLGQDRGMMVAGDGEMLMMRETFTGAKFITHVNLVSGESRTEEFHATGKMIVVNRPAPDNGGGLPTPTDDPAKPLDPNKIAEQAQNLKTPGRIALPAILANSRHQQELFEAMKDDADPKKPAAAKPANGAVVEDFTLVPGKYGYLQYSVKLLEQRTATREAMKAPPKKSVMDGALTAAQTTEAANEILNEMQRNNGGDKVEEDVSRYQITLRRPDASDAPDWTGEVVGYPSVYSLKTVNVIAAGKTVIVLDKANKKIWDSTLTFNVAASRTGMNGEPSPYGEGPCVENGGHLYVYDEAVLTAFDLANGSAQWRLPSVGIVGLFLDDQGMIYVNTTTASPDKIKYSRQIDIAESIDSVVLKVDSKDGKNLWTAKTGGFACYVSGPYIYTMQSHDVADDDPENDLTASLQKPPVMKLFRISPKDGSTIWEHDQERCPLSVEFDKNYIYLVFHREVQVLKYLTF